MAMHLDEVPEFRCTINLVPSLLVQIDAYVNGATDKHLTVSRMPAEGLERDDALYLLDNFFMAYADAMIRPHPRYLELLQQRGLGVDTAEQALGRFRERDLRDLQVWSNLCVDAPDPLREGPRTRRVQGQGPPLLRGREAMAPGQAARPPRPDHPPAPQARRARAGRADDHAVLSSDHPPAPGQATRPRGDARRQPPLLPRRLSRGCRIPRPTRRGEPSRTLRRGPSRDVAQRGLRHPGDDPAAGQARHRMDRHRRGDPRLLDQRQGRPRQPGPRPPPGAAVSPLEGQRRRPRVGHRLPRPRPLRPGRLPLSAQPRERRGGGFPRQAARHRRRLPPEPSTLVPVILDGENCWEYFPDGGVSFLRSLYQNACRDHRVRPTTIGEFLREHPPTDTLPRLFSGSWISHNFAIWIGHDEDNRGVGRPARHPPVPRPRGRHRRPRPGDARTAPGESCTSPRAPTGSGGTATTTPAPSTPCSTTSSASTCATFTPCSTPSRPAHSSPRSPSPPRGAAPCTTSRPASSRSTSTAARRTSNGSTRRNIYAGTIAGR